MNGLNGRGEAGRRVAHGEPGGRIAGKPPRPDGVGHVQGVQGRSGETLICRSDKQPVGGHGTHRLRSALRTGPRGLREGARRADKVVHDDGGLSIHVSHEGAALHPTVMVAHFLDERRGHLSAQCGPQSLGKLARPLHPSLVRRHNHDVRVHIFHEATHEERMSLQVLGAHPKGVLKHGQIVHVHREHPVDTDGFEKTRDVAGGHRAPRLRLAVLSLVAQVGHNGRDARGGGVAQGPQQKQQPAELIVHAPFVVRVERLDHEGVVPAHVHLGTHLVLAIGEGALVVGGELGAEGCGHSPAKRAALGGSEESNCVGHERKKNKR